MHVCNIYEHGDVICVIYVIYCNVIYTEHGEIPNRINSAKLLIMDNLRQVCPMP